MCWLFISKSIVSHLYTKIHFFRIRKIIFFVWSMSTVDVDVDQLKSAGCHFLRSIAGTLFITPEFILILLDYSVVLHNFLLGEKSKLLLTLNLSCIKWAQKTEDGLITGVLLWDLSTAFDTLDCNRLCDKLELFGVQPKSVKMH